MLNAQPERLEDEALRVALRRRAPAPAWAAIVARRAVRSQVATGHPRRWRMAMAAALLALVAGVAAGISWQRRQQNLEQQRAAATVRQLEWALHKTQEQMRAITGRAVRDGVASLTRGISSEHD